MICMIKGGNKQYKMNCYGSLYRIICNDSIYKICILYLKGSPVRYNRINVHFFIVFWKLVIYSLLSLKSLYTFTQWKSCKIILIAAHIRTICTCYQYYIWKCQTFSFALKEWSLMISVCVNLQKKTLLLRILSNKVVSFYRMFTI